MTLDVAAIHDLERIAGSVVVFSIPEKPEELCTARRAEFAQTAKQYLRTCRQGLTW